MSDRNKIDSLIARVEELERENRILKKKLVGNFSNKQNL
jgi:hypothetical protein